MFQVFSQQGRAFIIAQEFLPGFLLDGISCEGWFKQLKEKHELEATVGVEEKDFALLYPESSTMEEHLKTNFPGVYASVLRQMFSRRQELLDYWTRCKECRDSVDDYSTYVFGYLEPW